MQLSLLRIQYQSWLLDRRIVRDNNLPECVLYTSWWKLTGVGTDAVCEVQPLPLV